MDKYKADVIKTAAMLLVMVMVLSLPMGAFAACGHKNCKSVLVQKTTCCEPGVLALVCSDCGKTVKENNGSVPPTGEHEDTQVEVKPPLCEKDGEAKIYCATTGKLIKTEKIDKLGHHMEQKSVDKATCTEDGKINLYCIRCRKESTALTEKALGHKFDTGVVCSATCTEDGYTQQLCSRCGFVEETVIPATDHKLKTVSVSEPTCTTGGKVVWACENCDFTTETLGAKALGHQMTGGAEEVPATCEKDGYYRVYCDRCGYCEEEIYPAKGHQMTGGAEYVPATCEKDGYYRVYCSNCDYFSEEVRKATGHNLVSIGIVPSDCEGEGLETLGCTNYGCEYTENKTIPAKDHKLKTVSVSEPTCTTGGKVVWACENCDFTTETLGAKALGHQMTGGAEEVPATCEKDGYYRVCCDRCGYCEEEIYPAKGHFTAASVVLPTCEKDGYSMEACSNCDYEVVEVLPAKGHQMTGGAEYVPATCEKDGYYRVYCSNCDYFSEEVRKATGHNLVSIGIVPSDCEREGLETLGCTNYGCEHTENKVIPKTSHHYKNTGLVVKPTCEEDGYVEIGCTYCGHTFTATLPALGHEMGTAEEVCSTCVKQGYFKQECTRCDYREFVRYTLVPHEWIYSITSSSESRFMYQYRDCAVCGAHNVTRILR